MRKISYVIRLTRTLYPHPTITNISNTSDFSRITYNSFGDVTAIRRRDGRVITQTINAAGQVTARNIPGAPNESYVYDMVGRLVRANGGISQHYAYDALGRLTQKTHGSNQVMPISYNYDAAGRMSRLTHPDGFAVDYEYDTLSRPRFVKQGDRTLASLSYDGRGLLKRITYGHDFGRTTSRNYSYDGGQRLLQLSFDTQGTGYDQTYTYSYSPANEIISKQRTNSVYDHNPGFAFSESYTSNGLNQHTSINGTSLAYDGAGNLTQDQQGRLHIYDAKGQLDRTTTASGSTIRKNNYYPDGGMRTSSDGRLYHDGDQEIVSYHDGLPIGGSDARVRRRYIRIPGMVDEAFLMIDEDNNGAEYWAYPDERGSVVATAQSNGFVNGVHTYDEFGRQGGNVDSPYPFRYTGQRWDGRLGLYYYKARHYDPQMGRFLQPDPIGYGDGLNIYNYVGGDPVNFRDPSGLTLCDNGGAGCDSEVIVQASRGGGGGGGFGFGPSLAFGAGIGIGGALAANQQTFQDFVDSFDEELQEQVQCDASRALFFAPGRVTTIPPPVTAPQTQTALQRLVGIGRLLGRTVGAAAAVGLEVAFPPPTAGPELTESNSRNPQVLFHFTSEAGLAGILASQSIVAGPRGRFGTGVFFTDIVPGTNSNRDLAHRIGGPIRNRTHFVAVDVSGLPVIQGDPVRAPNNFHVPLPAGTPLSIAGRIVGSGPNQPCGEN